MTVLIMKGFLRILLNLWRDLREDHPTHKKGMMRMDEKNKSLNMVNSLNSPAKLLLRRRKHLYVIAVDFYDSNEEPCAQKLVNMM